MDPSVIRRALADAVRTGVTSTPKLTCYGFAPDSFDTPCFYAGEVEINPLQTFGDMDEMVITCRVLVSHGDDNSSQAMLDGFLKRTGAGSVRAALAAAAGAPGQLALGGAADDLVVTRIGGYRMYQVGTDQYYGAEITVRVIGEEA